MPTVTIFTPPEGESVTAGEPLLVSGQASDVAGAEPVLIDSVTVRLDSQAPVEAHLVRKRSKTQTLVDFSATVGLTGASGTAGEHAITVVATNDNGVSRTATRTVFVGPAFDVDAPAVVVDLQLPTAIDAHDSALVAALGRLQVALVGLSGQLAGAGKVLIGPNAVTALDGDGLTILRLGLWVEDTGFITDPPDPPSFPLPRLRDEAAQAGFALVPLLPVGRRTGFTDLPFGVYVAQRSLQSLVDSALAAHPDGNVDSITVSLEAASTVVTTYAGRVVDGLVPYTITVAETLGLALDVPDGPVDAPTVTSSHSSSVGDVPDWLLGTLVTILDLGLFMVWQEVSRKADATGGVAGPLVANLPVRVPFHPSDLPIAGPQNPFPVVVANWSSLGVSTGGAGDALVGILGSADATVQTRDQSTVSILLDGPDFVQVPPGEPLANLVLTVVLHDLAPDDGLVTWQLTSPFDQVTRTDTMRLDTFGQVAFLDVDFPMPLHASPGDYTYHLSASAQETGPAGAGVLSASASHQVTVRKHAPVVDQPKAEAKAEQPAA